MRVHELAKALDIPSKELIEALHDLGVEAKSHMTNLEDNVVALMKEEYGIAPDQVLVVPETSKQKSAKAAPPPPKPEVKEIPEKPVAPAQKPIEKKSSADTKALPEKKKEKRPEKQAERPAEKQPEKQEKKKKEEAAKVIRTRGPITVKELAALLNLRPNQVIAELMSMNILASITERVDTNAAKEISEKHGFIFEHEKKAVEHSHELHKHDEQEEQEEQDKPEDLMPRAPIVTFLGHVDHGKTSLLDKIKNTSVAASESGGITQHIGSYQVDVGGRLITFLDTPGHAAFNSMRARGANLTDIAVIVIAADDGIMPQTKEAIEHARKANVTMIIAINKIDLPAANPDRVKQQLQAAGLTSEDWGGEIICCEVSAQTGKGIDHLLEMILLQADMMELKANPNRRAMGYVVEARLEPGMGPTTNLLVTNGTLSIADFILCGQHCGKVKALINDKGINMKSAGPAQPVKCLGLSGVPEAGAEFRVYANEKIARTMAAEAKLIEKSKQMFVPKQTSIEALFDQIKSDEKLELNIILKTDTQGSLEAITQALNELTTEKVNLNIVSSGTGNITVNDIIRAGSPQILVLGFHVDREPGVKKEAKRIGVQSFIHSIIYELIDQVKQAMTALLPPIVTKHIRGSCLVKQTFPIGKKEQIAGCMVTSGYITPKLIARVKRGEEILHEGRLLSLKHFKNEVAQVKEAQECGIRLDGFAEFQTDDIIEFYEVEETPQTL